MNRVILHVLFILLAAASLSSFVLPVPASSRAASPQAESVKAKEELPFGDLFTPAELSKNFDSHQFTPFGESKFSLEILVPKGWEAHLSEVDPEQLAHDTKAAVPMVEFYPSGADDVGVQVLYMRVPGQGPLDRFMNDYAKNANGTILTRQKLEYKGRTLEDALLRTNDDSLGPLLSRVTAFRRGDIVFIFSGWGVDEKYEKNKRVFAAVLASLNPTGQ